VIEIVLKYLVLLFFRIALKDQKIIPVSGPLAG